MVKICHIVSGDLWAGPEVQLADLLPALAKKEEIELHVLLLNSGALATKLMDEGVKVTVIDESKNSFIKILLESRKLIQSFQPSIIHSHRYKENLLAFLLSFFLKPKKVALVQTVHGLVELHSGFKNLKLKTFLAIDKFLKKKAFKLIFPVSKDIKNYLDSFLDESKSALLHNAINLSRSSISNEEKSFRKEFNISEDTFLFLYLGRLVPVKGLELLIESSEILFRDEKKAKLCIAGDGPELENLKNLTQKLKIEERVLFTGFLENTASALDEANVFVMSSIHEGIPISLLESMLFKKPVISTNVGGISEVAEDGKSSILINSRSSSDYSKAMKRFLNEPELAKDMGKRGREIIDSNFSLGSQLEKLVKFYKGLV